MKKVLLILETKELQTVLRDALLRKYEVIVCNPEDAYAVMSQSKPDALLFDLFFPGIDSLTLLDQIRDVCPPAVVMLTILINEEIMVKAGKLGVSYMFRKPCSISAIVRKLDILLE